MTRVLRSAAFASDLTAAYTYLSDHNPPAADRFFDEVEITIELLAAFPAIGRARGELRRGVRSIRLWRFPYIVFYRAAPGQVTMLRIVHAARDHRRIRLG
ncbi:MAG: type II toxin-antitoxin system RelE/ParE family toxin [Alphaproteobacteria bacterium]|nr:type II toxin-antitoxin system RelE/ParE family toxin [Alphaproteobacteria bacterium]